MNRSLSRVHVRPRLPGLLRGAAAAAVLGLAAAAAAAQTTATPTAPAASATPSAPARATLTRAERSFIENAARGGLAEVALGRLAQQRAADAKVKQFGERMVQDHGKAHEELGALARERGVTLPTEPDRAHRRDSDRLAKRSGADFDRDFMKQMVDDHRKTVADFERTAKSAKDSAVRDFAARTLPTLQAHLEQARSTFDAVRKGR